MSVIRESVQDVLRGQASNQNAVFVFPTDIACQKWADWLVRNTSVKAVAMERFLAWDKFKGECIRSDVSELKTVPAMMRKIFADCLIQRNGEKPFFKRIINEKYADEASGFVDWISSVLPSLKMWKNVRDGRNLAGKTLSFDDDNLRQFYESYSGQNFTDDEDRDFEILYDEYKKFLSENRFFDPAWVETDFSGDGREYFLIYPEILEDWEQYKYKLSSIDRIHFVSVPEEEGEYEGYFFENSSLEVKNVALFLRKMHDENKIEWSDMAVNVPNLDNFGSYIDREFSLYEIPRSVRYSRPLSSYGAGNFFAQLQECVSKRFSYQSVKNLLLNEDLPWNNKKTIDNLLLFGRMNNCICTPQNLSGEGENFSTVWDEAFKNPKDDRGTKLNSDLLKNNLFKNLFNLTEKMVKAESFEKIRTVYENFRELFFDMEQFQHMDLSNNVLSRCIIALNEIIDLEKQYPAYKVKNPFAFFVSQLSKIQYLSQGEQRAVQVYPYKSAPAAPYKVHVLMDATQDSLSVADAFKPLSFMNENKRRLFIKLGEIDKSLGFSDSDPTFDFVRLYQHSGLEKAYFTASRHAYNGEYGFAYGKLEKISAPVSQNAEDAFAAEKKLFVESQDGKNKKIEYSSLGRLYSKQFGGVRQWIQMNGKKSAESGLFEKNAGLTELIRKRLHYLETGREPEKRKNPALLDKIEITQTTLKEYFKCPRRWLFKNIFRLTPLDNEAELIDEFIYGKVNHKIFELFFGRLGEKRLCASDENKDRLGAEFRKILIESICDAVNPQSKDYFFSEEFSSGFKRNVASQTTIRVISSQYEISDAAKADENQNFRLLERSIARLCSLFTGYTVYAVEKDVYALPENENMLPVSGYYYRGTVDCILAAPNKNDFIIVDYKNSGLPSNLFVKEQNPGKKENVIDFQMPMYKFLLENNIEEKERLHVSAAVFYSIKKGEPKFFYGSASGDSDDENENAVKLAEAEFHKYAKRFFEEVSEEKFA
ncbi:MAG: PD-(D/E)XK nuclease family protein, partial [Treponema sp.]|nr:PD-(D/E)XK nuclease family protein [Treponema sp.]